MSRLSIRFGAPAAVVLATVVNAAAANGQVLTPVQAPAPDLSWALQGGATHCGRMTRVFLARRAATAIRSLDRLPSDAKPAGDVLLLAQPAALGARDTIVFSPAQQPAHSTHQHSAP